MSAALAAIFGLLCPDNYWPTPTSQPETFLGAVPEEEPLSAWLQGDALKGIEKSTPMRRIGYASDMAGLALFLSSPAGNYINGAVIPIDGGIHLA